VFDLNLLASNPKKRCSVTHEHRSYALWRAKIGAAPTVQGTRVRASSQLLLLRQQAVHDGDGLQLQLAADEQVEPFLLLGAVGLLASGEEGGCYSSFLSQRWVIHRIVPSS
jgi:hypothetical protein